MQGSRAHKWYNRRAAKSAFVVLIVALLVIGGYFLVSQISGLSYYAVTSGSMTPTLKIGYVVVTQRITANALHVGNIIVYKTTDTGLKNVLLVHRIISITYVNGSIVGFVTKGDANPYPDYVYGFEPLHGIPPNDIVGKVILIVPYLGLIRLYLSQDSGIEFIASILLLSIGLDLFRQSRRGATYEKARTNSYTASSMRRIKRRNLSSHRVRNVHYRNLKSNVKR
jgi:signal peptidase